MTDLGAYVLSVGTAALIVGILTSLVDSKSSSGTLIKMVCGLFVVFTVLSPLGALDLDQFSEYVASFDHAGEVAVSRGKDIANDALRDIIKQQTEAYILDKASLYDAKLDVQVWVEDCDNPVPESVRIGGSVSPYIRSQLQQMIAKDLGIPKEKQIWTG